MNLSCLSTPAIYLHFKFITLKLRWNLSVFCLYLVGVVIPAVVGAPCIQDVNMVHRNQRTEMFNDVVYIY